MSRTITFHFSGNCPYTNSKQTIDLDYFEINMVGNMTPGYKKGNYSCPHSEECPYPVLSYTVLTSVGAPSTKERNFICTKTANF